MFRRKKEIPPPLNIPAVETVDDEIMLPFELAEWPRMILRFLYTTSRLDQDIKDLIATLAAGYDIELAGYVGENYGFGGLVRANAVTDAVAEAFIAGVNASVEATADELFSRLEEDMNRDGEE